MNTALQAPRRAHVRLRTVLVTALASTLTATLMVAPSHAAAAPTATVSTTPASSTTPWTGALTAATTTSSPVTSAPSTSAKHRSVVRITRSSSSQITGVSGIKLRLKVRADGKRVSGKARIYVSGKRVKTIKVHNGSATYRLPKSIKAGKRTVTVRFVPNARWADTVKPSVKRMKINVRSKASKIVQTALQYRGVRYRAGGSTPRGFDCSGFTKYVFDKAVGEDLSRTSSGQRRDGKVVSRKNARPGDLIWTPGHVAIYLGGNRQIDAPRPGKTIQVRKIWQRSPTFIRV